MTISLKYTRNVVKNTEKKKFADIMWTAIVCKLSDTIARDNPTKATGPITAKMKTRPILSAESRKLKTKTSDVKVLTLTMRLLYHFRSQKSRCWKVIELNSGVITSKVSAN